MVTQRNGNHVQSATDLVERKCAQCEWEAVATGYPDLISKYQRHLREEHPKAWLRG